MAQSLCESTPPFRLLQSSHEAIMRRHKDQVIVPGTSLSGVFFPVTSDLQLSLIDLVDCLAQISILLQALPAQESGMPFAESQRCNQVSLTVSPVTLQGHVPMTPKEARLLALSLSQHMQRFGLDRETRLECSRGFWYMGSIKIEHTRFPKGEYVIPV